MITLPWWGFWIYSAMILMCGYCLCGVLSINTRKDRQQEHQTDEIDGIKLTKQIRNNKKKDDNNEKLD